jgi:hypothetical protein
VPAQIRHDDPVALSGEQGRDVDVAVNVVGPAVQENHGWAVGRSGFGVADGQGVGLDRPDRAE